MVNVHHHKHLRKRVYKNLEKYPNKDPIKRFFDKLVYIAGIATPILTLPQLFEVWVNKNAIGVSLFTWCSYLLMAIIFSIYGFLHKEKPLIIMYVSMSIIEFFLIIGIIIYG